MARHGRPMLYASVILELSDETVYSVERVVNQAKAQGFLISDTEGLGIMRRRAYDSLSKFSRKNLGEEYDEMVFNRRNVPMPGWFGWRWKLALPEKYQTDPEVHRQLLLLEERWLDEYQINLELKRQQSLQTPDPPLDFASEAPDPLPGFPWKPADLPPVISWQTPDPLPGFPSKPADLPPVISSQTPEPPSDLASQTPDLPPDLSSETANEPPRFSWLECLPGFAVGLLILILYPIVEVHYHRYQAKQTREQIAKLVARSGPQELLQACLFSSLTNRSLQARVQYFNLLVDLEQPLKKCIPDPPVEGKIPIRWIDPLQLEMNPYPPKQHGTLNRYQ